MKKLWRIVFAAILCCVMFAVGVSAAAETVTVTTVEKLQSAHSYTNNMDKTWVYTHPTSVEWLDITFSSDTATENNYDYIYIYDGNGTEIGKYTGTTLSGKTVQVTGSTVKIRLTSDSSQVKYGFRVTSIQAGPSAIYWDGTVASGFAGGTGTEADPYQIATAEQLAFLAESVNSGTTYEGQYIKLTADIALNDTRAENWTENAKQWTPIGTHGYYKDPFDGTFDGGNHTIRGLYIDTTSPYQGLFSYTSGATFKNLTVANSSVSGGEYIGALVGYADGTTVFTNCTNSGDVSVFADSYSYAGGIVGACYSTTTFENCTNSGNISSTYSSSYSPSPSYTGGIAGYCESETTFENCTNSGDISYSSDYRFGDAFSYAGGIVGYCSSTATFTGCTNNGNISSSFPSSYCRGGAYFYAGGIAGYCESWATFENCVNSGDISSSATSRADSESYSDCRAYSYAGGIVGYCDLSAIFTDCTNNGDISATAPSSHSYLSSHNGYCCYAYSYAGGIAGYCESWATFENCVNSGNISSSSSSDSAAYSPDASSYAGGIAAYCDSTATFAYCTNNGDISASSSSDDNDFDAFSYAGGIAGYCDSTATFTGCTNSGDVSASSSYSGSSSSSATSNHYDDSSYAGGIAGYVGYSYQSTNSFENCTNSGAISSFSSSEVYSFYASSYYYCNAYSYAGGIVGYCSSTAAFEKCSNDGKISATAAVSSYSSSYHRGSASSYAGGIAGDCYSTATFTDCTNNGEISATATSYVGGIAGHCGSSATFENCMNSGDISSDHFYAGGIVGDCDTTATFTDCTNNGTISGPAVGGIAGHGGSGSTFTDCTNSGDISASSDNGGGIAGHGGSGSTFTDCTNSGDISASSDNGGGIVGSGSSATFVNCTNSGDVSGKYAGGIAAYCDSTTTFTDCTNSGNVSASSHDTSSDAGGIAGHCGSDTTFTNCTNSGDISSSSNRSSHYRDASSYAGGIAGCGSSATFENCTNSGNISSVASAASSISSYYDASSYAGGIVGYCSSTATFTDCTNNGEVSATASSSADASYAGGIAGYVGSGSTFENCYNIGSMPTPTGTTSSGQYAGGIVGYAIESIIRNCFNTGTFYGYQNVGGIVGYMSEGSIFTSYNLGTVKGIKKDDSTPVTYIGAVVGQTVNSVSISNCYYLRGCASDDLGNIQNGIGSADCTVPTEDVPESTLACPNSQLKQQATYAGFDFDTFWTMAGSAVYLYPELQSVAYTGGAFTPENLVNAAIPHITAQPVSASYVFGMPATELSVIASVSDSGILSYQWYVGDTEDGAGTAVSGANTASFIPDVSEIGVKYYYVVITNTNPAANDITIAEIRSDSAMIIVQPRVDAAVPTITQQPEAYLYCVAGNDAPELTVSAVVPDSGNLSYQWYVNTENSTTGGTPIEGATAEKYTPSTTEAGIRYYYVTVTNTNSGVNGTKTASAVSNISIVFVVERVDAATPVISAQPQSAVYTLGDEAISLRVSAQISDAGTLYYQWYSNTVNAADGGTAIPDAVSAEFTPPTDVPGTVYYYVVVTNTNSSVNGTKSVSVVSDTAHVFVKYNAALPLVTNEPVSGEYVEQQSIELSVTAEGNSLTYQWYVNTEDSTDNGTAIPGAENAVYTFVPDYVGMRYYYVRITNSDPEATGEKTGSVFSRLAAIRVLPLVHATEPTITSQPLSAAYTVDYPSEELSVTASVTDGGTLRYQWYVSLAENAEGTAIPGANDSRYTPPTDTVGVRYYYAVVTNTNSQVTGTKSVSVSTNTVSIQIIPKVDAVTPVIEKQPLSGVYTVGGAIENLSITASVTDGGTLYYQWYTNTANKNTGGTPIEGAVHASYTPGNTEEGLVYYYVVITNRNEQATGVRESSIASNCAAIILTPATLAATPIISCHPESAVYTAGAAPTVLSVIASVSDGGSLSYQWFSNTTNSNVGGTAITGATAASYTPSTASVGTFYYYVVVTNTNDKVTGEKSVSVASSVVSVTVNPKFYTIRGSITSFGEGDVTIALLKDGTEVDGVTITVTADSYTITDVPAGTYILRVSKPKHVTREYTVTVGTP